MPRVKSQEEDRLHHQSGEPYAGEGEDRTVQFHLRRPDAGPDAVRAAVADRLLSGGHPQRARRRWQILNWMYELGPWNFLIGFAFMVVGLLMTMRWR